MAQAQLREVAAKSGVRAVSASLNLVELIRMISRRKGLILGTIALLTLAGTAATLIATPTYTAQTDVLLDVRKTTVIDMQAVVGGLQGGDVAAIRSEVDVISSPSLLERVVSQLNLLDLPAYNPDLDRKSHLRDYLPKEVRDLFITPEPAMAPGEHDQSIMNAAIKTLQGNLGVFNDQGRSYTIRVSYTSPDPKLAARVVNAVAQQYLNAQLESKFDKTRNVNEWLQAKLGNLKKQVEGSENAVQAYRKANNILLSTNGSSVIQQQIADLNAQIAIANADSAQKHGRLEQFQRTVRKGLAEAQNAPEVLVSPTITQLKSSEADIGRRLAELGTRFGDKHPAIISAKQELASVEGRIANEIQKVVGNLTNDAQGSDLRVQQLRSDLTKLAVTAQQNNQLEVPLRELDRQAQSDRQLYETYLGRFKETSETQDIQQPDASIIAKAVIPTRPSFPNKPLYIFLAFLGSACVGVALALMAEHFETGFRTGSQIEDATGVAGIGMLPSVGGRPHDELVRHPSSIFSESIRSIRSALINVERPARVIMVTSAAEKEGKSTMALSLARASAQAGRRTLLIDCDLRRPSLHTLIGVGNEVSLYDAIARKVRPQEVVLQDPTSKLEFIPAREGLPNPNDFLASVQMKQLVNGLSQDYDVIILDTPPVMAASDASILSRLADATLFVVRWEKTPREMVVNAIKVLQKQDARIWGVVLSRVNLRKHARYGYGDQAFYYGRYKGYVTH